MLVDPEEYVHHSNCPSYHEGGVIAVSRTVTLIATDPPPVRTAEAMAGGMVS